MFGYKRLNAIEPFHVHKSILSNDLHFNVSNISDALSAQKDRISFDFDFNDNLITIDNEKLTTNADSFSRTSFQIQCHAIQLLK